MDLLAELALGALPEDETRVVEAHLLTCEKCRAELVNMERVASLLPLAAEDMSPKPSVKAGLLERIGTEPRPMRARPRGRPRWQWAGAIAAAAALLVVSGAVLGASLFSSRSNPNSDRQETLVEAFAQGTAATSRGEQGGASVTLLRAPGEKDAFVWVANLPALPSEKAYQAWFTRDGTPEPSTVFRDGSGGVWLEAGDVIDRFATMALTIEESAGSKTPTDRPFVVVELQNRVRASLNQRR